MADEHPVSLAGWKALGAAGLSIAGAFWGMALLHPARGEHVFMALLGIGSLGYLAAVALLAAGVAPRRRALVLCLALALSWRVPLLWQDAAPAGDAVRYVWDARVQRTGLSPYHVRPDDTALQWLHTDLTKQVDAAWLPTIYPPVAQLYFRAVAGVHESITAFRVAALICDGAIMLVLPFVLGALGRPIGWTLAYAWHPLLPLEGVSGAHVDLAGVLLLAFSWLALVHRRPAPAALAFVAAVLVKPLPLVLAPLYWRRVGVRDVGLAALAGGLATAWVARGQLPIGSLGAFIAEFRFNGPVFELFAEIGPSRGIAGAAVVLGMLAAVRLRRHGDVVAPWLWAWPMALALAAAPVIYPWYLVWLVPFSMDRRALPVWAWTLSIFAVYPTWHLQFDGGPFSVPADLLWIEFGVPLALAVAMLARTQALSPARTAGAARG